MIDYKLAKQLKDAGYHQKDVINGGYGRDKESFIYSPQLEELIDACGDELLGIHKSYNNIENTLEWYADTHTYKCECGKDDCGGFNWEHETGKTPEEAVARLWLALNTPQNKQHINIGV